MNRSVFDLLTGSRVVKGLVAGVMMLVVQLTALSQCQEPNPSTKNCFTVPSTGAVSWCDGLSSGACSGAKVYTVKQFPSGAVTASKGATKEIQDLCYQTTDCVWNKQTGKCESGTKNPGPGPAEWWEGTKTVDNSGAKCPTGG